MFTIILFAIFGLIFGIAVSEFDDFVSSVVSVLMIGFVILLFALLGLGVAFLLPMKTIEKVDTFNIVNLQDNKSLSGNFYLGSGVINDKMKYFFYYKDSVKNINGEEQFKLMSVPYDRTYIVFSDSLKKVKRYRQDVENSVKHPWWPKYVGNWFAIDAVWDEDCMKYVIYVPKGTIREDFKLDAQ